MSDRYMRMREETLMLRRLSAYDLEDGIGDLVTADSEEEDDFEDEAEETE